MVNAYKLVTGTKEQEVEDALIRQPNIPSALLREDAYVTGSEGKRIDLKKIVALGDSIIVQVSNLPELLSCAGGKAIVLSINERPLLNQLASPPLDPKRGFLRFSVQPNADNRKDWIYNLGRPDLSTREIRVSVAIQDSPSIPSQRGATLQLRVISPGYFLLWLAAFLGFLAMFAWLAHRSNILRVQPIDMGPGMPERGQYSLSRTQAAWWFFVVLAMYILIGLVTGEYESALNGTALTLLGIGASTAIGAAVIDASAAPDDTANDKRRAEIDQKRQAVDDLKKQLDDAVTNKNAGAPQIEAQLRTARQQLDQLLGTSRGIILDIVSDANGVVFHRFQIVAWTLVLTVVFVREVYLNLTMADFSDTLLGLQGLSSITYLGLKIPEARVSKSTT